MLGVGVKVTDSWQFDKANAFLFYCCFFNTFRPMNIFDQIKNDITALGFRIVDEDRQRPWGGFFVIDESQAPDFANHFFGIQVDTLKIAGKLSPKILIVAPGQRLSWQYHHRRAEIWKSYRGNLYIARSQTDEIPDALPFEQGQQISLAQGERHRLIGGKNYGVVAEIWQHTDVNHPSDEDDIIRLEDDYARN
jgi:mannose-6-phosphate isomerase